MKCLSVRLGYGHKAVLVHIGKISGRVYAQGCFVRVGQSPRSASDLVAWTDAVEESIDEELFLERTVCIELLLKAQTTPLGTCRRLLRHGGRSCAANKERAGHPQNAQESLAPVAQPRLDASLYASFMISACFPVSAFDGSERKNLPRPS